MSTGGRQPPPEPVFTLRSVAGEVTALHSHASRPSSEFGSSADDSLVSGHDSGDLQIWDLTTYRAKLRWSAHPSSRVQWIGSCNDDRIFSYGRDGLFHAWTIDGQPIKVTTVVVNCCTHCPCDVSLSGTLLATPTDQQDASATIHDMPFDKNTQRTRTTSSLSSTKHGGMIMTLKFIGTSFLLVAYEAGFIRCCRTNDGVEVSRLNAFDADDMITCLDFHLGTMRGIAASSGRSLVFFDLSAVGEIRLIHTVSITNPGVACVRVRSDGRYCVAGGWDHRIRLFSWTKFKPLAVIEFHSDTVQCLSFVRRINTSNVLLVAGSRDGRISFWDLYNEKK